MVRHRTPTTQGTASRSALRSTATTGLSARTGRQRQPSQQRLWQQRLWQWRHGSSTTGRRRRLRRRFVATVVATFVAVVVHHSVDAANTERRSWRADSPVLVLQRAVRSGGSVTDVDVRLLRRPRALTPDDALTSLPVHPTAVADLSAGTVLSAGLIESRSGSATARALPAGSVAIAVRTGELPRLAEPGDVVDVVSPSWEQPVANRATVLAVDGDAVTVAVDDDDAAASAAASLSGPVALVLRR